jgi:hypothetical protein
VIRGVKNRKRRRGGGWRMIERDYYYSVVVCGVWGFFVIFILRKVREREEIRGVCEW